MSNARQLLLGGDASFWHPAHFANPQERLPATQLSVADRALLALLYQSLQGASPDRETLARIDRAYRDSSLPQRCHRFFFVLYAPGQRRLMVSRSASGRLSFAQVFARLHRHPRFAQVVAQPHFLQLDLMLAPPMSIELYRVGMELRGERHFEIGIDGLEIHSPSGRVRYFLPGDAFVRSIMSMGQLRDYLAQGDGEEELREANCHRFRTASWLVGGAGACYLYRGLPAVGPLSRDRMTHALELAVDHILRTQQPDGKFLYYYDGAKDSRWDFEHPTRHPQRNPYYNILRHSGGGLTCLYREKYCGGGRATGAARKAIEYLLGTARYYDCEGREAAYIYSEKKAKLGGSGVALYLVAEYQLLTGDRQFQAFADALAWHTVHQITDSGEFIYYNIYLDREIGVEENQDYFSFYYPGEALCGLGKYLHTVAPAARRYFFDHIHRALHYLIEVRPGERAAEYTAVPSDSWLMMAIMELWDFEPLRRTRYSDFVFRDARCMIEQMYKVSDAPYPDYAGAFYYNYGDYPYADGARLEGLLGAYELALKMGEEDVQRALWRALRLGAWAVMHLVNDECTMYAMRKPEIALGGIRFKYTRQWFRIDTIQHVASFLAKLLPYWDTEESRR